MKQVFVVVEGDQDELTHVVVGVFATRGAAKAAIADRRSAVDDTTAMDWAITEHVVGVLVDDAS